MYILKMTKKSFDDTITCIFTYKYNSPREKKFKMKSEINN